MSPLAAGERIDPEVVELVTRAQAGDQQAFGVLYDRYVDQVYGYVYRRVRHQQSAEDLTADVFLRACRRLTTFHWQGVDLGAWLITIARNRVNDHFKSARFNRERSSDGDHVFDVPASSHSDDPERVSLARDMARSLGSALERLKDEHREVIELRFVHGLSVTETAEVMHRSVGACKALQYRALKALAEEVRGEPGLAELAGIGVAGLLLLLRSVAV